MDLSREVGKRCINASQGNFSGPSIKKEEILYKPSKRHMSQGRWEWNELSNPNRYAV